jgi:uncharacterized protein YecE (DUF72 family)
MMPAVIYLGTSGFGYQAWRGGVFYPTGVSASGMLPYYASVFGSVEINYTFRQFPTEAAMRTWLRQTPEHFRFAIKAHRMITYAPNRERALAGLADFVARVQVLGERLGPIRFQFPPGREYDPDLLEQLLTAIPAGTLPVIDFRHDSWRAAWPLLADRGIARCVADSDEQPAGDDELSWRPFGYLRLRRASYSDAELAAWAQRITAAAGDGVDVHCYFMHEDTAAGPRMARRLAQLLA